MQGLQRRDLLNAVKVKGKIDIHAHYMYNYVYIYIYTFNIDKYNVQIEHVDI